mgnify:CR=1 FL=1
MLMVILANVRNNLSVDAMIYYSLAYSVGSITAFGILYNIGKNGNENIDAFNGLGKKNPILALCMSVALLSLAGIPPTAGFFAKYYIFTSAFHSGYAGLVLLALAVLALVFSVIAGVPLGVISAVRQNTLFDYALRVLSLSGLSLPSFWLGLLVLMAGVQWFGAIPIYDSGKTGFWNDLTMLGLPALVVGFRSSALVMRLTRSSMLEVLRQDYIRTARSKGASSLSVNYDHALRNALLPVVTVIGIEAAFLVGGLIVTETVFNIPGVARFLVEAILWRDYPIVQNLVMLIAFVVVMVNFLVDMAYMVLDPRIKFAD